MLFPLVAKFTLWQNFLLVSVVEVAGYDEKAIGVIGLLFADSAVQFTKGVLSVFTRGNVHSDNNNGRELLRQTERHFTTINSTSDEQCFDKTAALLHHSLLIYILKPPP